MSKENEVSSNEINVEEEKEIKSTGARDEVQITITVECERLLHEWRARINKGFELGRVTRKHLAVYVFEKMLAAFTEEDIKAVQQSTLTDFSLLDKLYRDIKASGVVPTELKEFLWKSTGLTQSPKRIKKSGQSMYSKDIHKDLGAA